MKIIFFNYVKIREIYVTDPFPYILAFCFHTCSLILLNVFLRHANRKMDEDTEKVFSLK